MTIREKVELIFKECGKDQETVRQIMLELQAICWEYDLDFDLALQQAEPELEDLPDGCDHEDAVPYADGSVYCNKCSTFIVKSRKPVPSVTPLYAQNLWRPNG